MLKARGLGKFCSNRLNGTKVSEMDLIFGKVQPGAIYLNFLGPAGGSRTQKGGFALQENTIWLVETEIAFSVEQQYFSRTTSGANCGKSDRRIFEKYFHKNGDISSSCRQILLRSFQSELFACRFRFWRREVWENSVARERVVYGLAKWTKFLEKWLLVRYSSIFRALPGAYAPGRVHSPFQRISYG